MTDVAAIRRTWLHGRADMVRYKDNLQAAIETAKSLVDEAMQFYDETIRQIQRSEGRRNGLFSTGCNGEQETRHRSKGSPSAH